MHGYSVKCLISASVFRVVADESIVSVVKLGKHFHKGLKVVIVRARTERLVKVSACVAQVVSTSSLCN